MTGVAQLLSVKGSVVTASGSSAVVDTSLMGALGLAVQVSAFTAGTTPTVTWTLRGLVAGLWVQLHEVATQDVADGLTYHGIFGEYANGVVIPAAVRLDWALNGTPTNATITYALIGRN